MTNKPMLSVELQMTERQECDLMRFYDTCEDSQPYDVPKDQMKSLARVGLVRSLGFSRYEFTDIGCAAIEKLRALLNKPKPRGDAVNLSAWIPVSARKPERDKVVLVAFDTHSGKDYTTAKLSQNGRAHFDCETWYVHVSGGRELQTVTHWLDFDCVAVEAKPAAQHQDEPVAELQVAFFEHGPMATINWFTPSAFESGATKLYAEKPAPVAVPLNSLAPFRTIIEKACEEFNYCCARSDDAGEAIAAHQGLRAMLDDWPSDNPVPAPVAVVMRECEHGGSAGKCLWCKSGNLELVLPNIRDVSGSSREQAMCASTWNACIAEVARLNGVKP